MPTPSPNENIFKSLEDEIGSPPDQSSFHITEENRKHVITWLTLKGLNSARHNSDETLNKLYSIPRYRNTAILNQKSQNKNKTFHYETLPEHNAFGLFPITPPPNLFSQEEDNIHKPIYTPAPTPSGSINSNQISEIISEVLQKTQNYLDKCLKSIQDNTENKIKHEIQIQNKELKKSIEETIFQSFINQKISNQTETQSLETPIENPTSQISSSFIPKLDTNYHFDLYATKVIRSALTMNENLYVYGDTGCGKTTHIEQVCAILNHGLIRINPHDGITREMFLGGMKLINNETIFIEGALPLAMKNGLVFLVDEISFLPPNLTAILNPIAEKGGKLYLSETSEWISPAPGFCIFATDNTGGKGDRTGQYTGTEVQNTATLDRFAFCLKMDYLPIEKEQEMLIKRFPNQDPNEINKMLRFAKDIRSAFSRGELSITFSTRKLIKFFDQRKNDFTIQESLSNTILSWLDEDDETLVKTIIDRLDLLKEKEKSYTTTELDSNTNLTMFKKFIENNLKN